MTDEIPLCSKDVITYGAHRVLIPAMEQSKRELWAIPTEEQIMNIETIIECLYTKENTKLLLTCVDNLGLQCRRAKTIDDSYLLIYTKPGVKNYNGPFIMFREHAASNVAIVSPHDGSDSTSIDTKLAFQNSKALVMISNGHRKWSRDVDFSKTKNTLGNYAIRKLADLVKRLVLLNIHGMIYHDFVLYRSTFPELGEIFESNLKKYVKRFQPFNAWYDLDEIKTPYRLKTEIPVKLHINRPKLLTGIVLGIENKPWAWGHEEIATTITITEPETYESDSEYCVDL